MLGISYPTSTPRAAPGRLRRASASAFLGGKAPGAAWGQGLREVGADAEALALGRLQAGTRTAAACAAFRRELLLGRC